ncbi:MAG: hypothetical protein IJU70_00045 [Lentisphaeria bacterium]|nr:hypothetical protein [Lentisphaeria bacterium]
MNISGLRQGAVRLCYWGYAEGRERIPPHEHDFWQAEFSLSGRCLVRTDTGEFALQDHALIILAPGVRHSLVYPEPCLCHTCKFHADLPDLPRVIYRPGSPFTRGVIQAAKVILETTFPARFFGVPEGAIVLPQDRYQILMEHFLAGVLASFRQERCEQSGLLERFYQAQEQRGGPFFTVDKEGTIVGESYGGKKYAVCGITVGMPISEAAEIAKSHGFNFSNAEIAHGTAKYVAIYDNGEAQLCITSDADGVFGKTEESDVTGNVDNILITKK